MVKKFFKVIITILFLLINTNLSLANGKKNKLDACLDFSRICYYMGITSSYLNCKDRVNLVFFDLINKNKIDLRNPKKRHHLTKIMKICRLSCELGKKVTYLEALEVTERLCKEFVKDY